MRRLFVAAFVTGCASASQPIHATQTTANPLTAVDSALETLTHAPLGTGASITVRVGGHTQTHVAGRAFVDGPSITPDTAFNVASVSKLLTAALILDLADRGQLHLNDTVAARLPGVRLQYDGVDFAQSITLSQLAMHRGGTPHQPDGLDPSRFGSTFTSPDLLSRLTESWSVTLIDAPGTYHYSNLGYALLGAVVERTTQASFAEAATPFMRSLGMQGATFWPVGLSNAAYGRVVQNNEEIFRHPDWYTSRYPLPFTGLWASSGDLAAFGSALMQAEGDDEAALHPMTISAEGHGVGAVHRTRGGHASLEHDGGGPGFLAWLIVVPARSVVVAVVCNTDGETAANVAPFRDAVDAVVAEAIRVGD